MARKVKWTFGQLFFRTYALCIFSHEVGALIFELLDVLLIQTNSFED